MIRTRFAYWSAVLAFLVCAICGTIFYYLQPESPIIAARAIREECSLSKDATQSRECFSGKLAESMQYGLAYVFSIVRELYATDEGFERGCHYMMHPIGKSAYARYKSGGSDFMVPDASACNYGFYHGFIGALMADTKDMRAAKHFCDSIEPSILAQRPDATNQCYHGLGHGFLEQFIAQEPVDIRDTASVKAAFRASTPPAIETCRSVASTTKARDNCISGLFHGIAMLQEAEGWMMDHEDPLWLCREQTDEYKTFCFGNQHRLVIDMMPNATLKEVVSFTKDVYGSNTEALSNVIWRWAYNHATDIDMTHEVILQCNEMDSSARTNCIMGGLSRTQENGPPGKEYIEAAKYCLDGNISQDDRTICAKRSFDYFKRVYPDRLLGAICKEYSDLYVGQCVSS